MQYLYTHEQWHLYGAPFVPKLPPIASFINNTSRIITTQTVYKCSHSFINEAVSFINVVVSFINGTAHL